VSNETFVKSDSGAGVVNTDILTFKQAMAKKKRDKYIKGLEQRIEKLESAMSLLQNTVKEIKK
jgi:hypothetical protein